MDQELKGYLDAMEMRLRAHSEAVESRMREHTEAVESRMREHTEAVETRLLGEFWKWARTADARYRQNQDVVNGLQLRVQIVEDRVAELERRNPS